MFCQVSGRSPVLVVGGGAVLSVLSFNTEIANEIDCIASHLKKMDNKKRIRIFRSPNKGPRT